MKPNCFLHEIYGPGLAYSGYAPPGSDRWLPKNRTFLQAITGNQLTVAGDMAILCAAGCASQAGLDLLGEAGFSLPRQLYAFRDEQEYAARLAELTNAGQRIVVQHRHPSELLAERHCWLAPDLLSRLNDKGNLADMVAPEHAPVRVVFKPVPNADGQPELPYPFLLKAATAHSTGGGALDIHYCHGPGDWAEAYAKLQASERLVAEQWLPARRFLCLNYAVDARAETRYLGSAEIINGADGNYLGNWLGEQAQPPSDAVELGRDIARRGAAAGYRGCLCVDLAELPDGRILAYDLNFRACGSTVPLLLFEAVLSASGASAAKFRSWSWQGDFPALIESARQAMRAGHLIPLASFDPGQHGREGPARINGLLIGAGRDEIVAREAELAGMGWA